MPHAKTMMIGLQDLLALVGELNDDEGSDTPRERFRSHLKKNVSATGTLRDYCETCLRNSGPQFHRALQDLINHAGILMGFDVRFGRYAGVQGKIGFDGLWKSPIGKGLVVEIKTTDQYAINTSTLLSYIDQLVDVKEIPSRDDALGLYVVGRADQNLAQLSNAIVAHKLSDRLRVSTVETILALLELVSERGLTHQEAVDLLGPSRPSVDDTIKIIVRMSAEDSEPAAPQQQPAERPTANGGPPTGAERMCLLTPVADEEDVSGEQIIRGLLDQGLYAFADRTSGLKELKPGDRLCFYWAGGHGVVAEGTVASRPEVSSKPVKGVKHPDVFRWVFRVKDHRYFFEKPVVIDAALRRNLPSFKGRDPDGPWAWFVQNTKRVQEGDFELLVGRGRPVQA